MADLQIDEEFDVFIDTSGDLAYARGRAAFEQKIAVALTDSYQEVVGELDPGTTLEQIKVGARRAVDAVDLIERLANVDARIKEDEPNTVVVDILFDTGEALTFVTDETSTTVQESQIYDKGIFEDTSSFDIYDDGVKV